MANGSSDVVMSAAPDQLGEAAGAAGAPPPAAAVAVPGPLRLARTLTGHTRAVVSLKLSPIDADLLASASADGTVRLWRVGEGRELTVAASKGDDDANEAGSSEQSGAPQRMAHSSGVNAVAWDPRGCLLATVADDGVARMWDAETGKLLREMPGHTNYAYCCQFDPAGRMLATGSFDETIRFWDVRSGNLFRETPAHSDPVTALCFSHDGTIVVSGSFDGLVRVWDARNGHCLRSYASSKASAPVNDVTMAPNDKYYLQATLDSTIRLVHVESGRCVKTYTGHRNEDYCCNATFVAGLPSSSGGGDMVASTDTGSGGSGASRMAVASGSEDGSLCVWDLDSRKVVQRELGAAAGGAGHSAATLCITAHTSRPLVLTGGQEPDCSIQVWEA